MLGPQLCGSIVLALCVVRAQFASIEMLVRHFPGVYFRYVTCHL
ncbi:hypothetical protein [Streptomyces sp. NPDC007094]